MESAVKKNATKKNTAKKDTGEKNALLEIREFRVIKHNDLIQRSRFNLTLQEQKIILYLISKIKPEDTELKEYPFKITEFCRVCGINEDSGENYRRIKAATKALADKSVWVKLDDGREALFRWINEAYIDRELGAIRIKLSDNLKPYLLQLKNSFTAYELLYTLAMKSQYSIRLYEILKSFEYRKTQKFDINDLKKLLYAENYVRYADFKRKVLDISLSEINTLSDINVSYEIEKEGKRFAKIEFVISLKKDFMSRLDTWKNIEQILDTKYVPEKQFQQLKD